MRNEQLDAQTSARLFRRAQAIKGGRERLAEHLGVQVHDVALWSIGKSFPPQLIFEAVLQVILDAYESRAARGESPGARENRADGRPSDPSRPRALVAESPGAFAVIAKILGDELDLIPVHSESEGLDIVQGSAFVQGRAIDVIICGLHFEASQMLDFLQCVKAYKPTNSIPFICCRVMPTKLSKTALAAMRETCEALGALAYIDVVDKERTSGMEAAAVEFRDAVRSAARFPKHLETARVLVVDDNPDSAHTLAALLRMAGYNVQKASTGADALRIARDFDPAVVILDIAMPGMSGYEVAERIRAESWGKSITLIALTGYGTKRDVASAEASSFNHHFLKPVALQTLLAVFPKPQSSALDQQ